MIGRRADGYHELRTLFQSVDLHDLLTLEIVDAGVALEVREGRAPAGDENLAARAARRYLERWAPDAGVRIELRKRIPIGGGLGGGSSNAAAVLRALQRLLGAPAPPADLEELARELGADVPFFLVEGTALGVGRGDEVIPLPDLPESEIWLVTPPVEISTAEVFSRLEGLTPLPVASSIMALARGDPPRSVAELAARNDLQDAVLRWYPRVREVYESLLDSGARVVRLSGTGATLFAVFESSNQDAALQRLPEGTSARKARTLTRVEADRRRVVRMLR